MLSSGTLHLDTMTTSSTMDAPPVHEQTASSMTVAPAPMGPPPPRNPNSNSDKPQNDAEQEDTQQNSSATMEETTDKAAPSPTDPPTEEPPTTSTAPVKTTNPMGPPPPKLLNSDCENPSNDAQLQEQQKQSSTAVPYSIPEWSGPPCHEFYLEVLKDGSIIDQFEVCKKGAYMFGRADLCDFVLEHPTVSRFHAVIQFKRSGNAYLYDVGSTHGTSINKNQVKKMVYVELHVGDVIRFGQSSRLYIFQGPSELMPPEKDLKIIRESKIREQMLDREESLRRARQDASLADGISWGMGEDAIEEDEDDDDEVTWQTYKGQLTEKQEKTREKVLKRLEKIAHMKKEIDHIRAKDIPQGGLTQGQQTQIARNEQRIAQIMEELENLEETLNESIRESLGARTRRIIHGKGRGEAEDEEDFSSDDDEFYDRTKKKTSVPKAGENQSVETADTLLDKRDGIMKQMEDKKETLDKEKSKVKSENTAETDAADALDAYMSGLSSQLVLDKTEQLQNELSTLQTELDRVLYLLKIADPTGEAARRRDSRLQQQKPPKTERPAADINKKPPMQTRKDGKSEKPVDAPVKTEKTQTLVEESNKEHDPEKTSEQKEGKAATYTLAKPQWLGAVEDKDTKERPKEEEVVNAQEPEGFIDYKDRQKMLRDADEASEKVDTRLEAAAPGLIIRKKNQVEKSEYDDKANDQSTSSSGESGFKAEDVVALLLKHKRGYHGEDEENNGSQERLDGSQSGKEKKKQKRVLGPEKPSFLDNESDYETWVPPEGQTGDGRTTLNERYGY